jgi:MSHA biogenesis protein MshP
MSTLFAQLSLRPQKGFAIVAAIFLLVVLSALGAFMLTISGSQHVTSAQDIQGTRAYWAAKAGIQWAASRINTTAACAAGAFVLDGFNVTVACVSHNYTEGTTVSTIYWVDSTAKTVTGNVGGISYAERTVNAFIEF